MIWTGFIAFPAVAAVAGAPRIFTAQDGQFPSYDFYVLTGQSDTVGRDTTELASQSAVPRIGFLGGGNHWYMALDPMYDGSGFGPGVRNGPAGSPPPGESREGVGF